MKKLFVLALAGLLTVSMTACGDKPEEKPSTEESVVESVTDESTPVDSSDVESPETEESTTEEGVALTKSQQVAYDFAKAIQTGDYETALGMLNIEDATFLTAADLEWFIPRSDFSDIQDTDFTLVEATSNGDKVNDVVTLNLKPVTVDVSVSLNDDNEWKVNFNDFYISSWNVKVPKGLTLKIGDIAVDSAYLSSREEHDDVYVIPAITNKAVTLTATSTIYGDATAEVTPNAEAYEFTFKLSEEKANNLMEALKTTLNQMNEAYEYGTTDFSSFVAPKADPQVATTLATSIEHQYTWNDSLDPWNIRFSIVEGLREYDEKTYEPVTLLENDVIHMIIKVEKTWSEKYDGTESLRTVGFFYVQEDGDALKIYGLKAEPNVIEERNSMTNDW